MSFDVKQTGKMPLTTLNIACRVIVVNVLMPLLINKFTSTVIPTLQVRYILHPNISGIEYCHG